ncbi:MAG: alginate lyase family protein [Candidatus Ornithospirochaeta sp.]|nr:alginate lyase family protein [Candidatus Ornithospirochaeta sp.]
MKKEELIKEIHIRNRGTSLERGRAIRSIFPGIAEEIIRSADQAMRGMLVLPGTGPEPFFVGNPPKWEENPCNDNEYTFSLNRLIHLKTMSEAYSLTGDEAYAEKVLSELEDWIDSEKRPAIFNPDGSINRASFESRSPWRALEVGIRGYRTLPMIIELTIDSPAFTDALLEKIARSAKEHMEVLFSVSPVLWPRADHNHYLMENLGLLSLSSMFPSLDDEGKYREHASHELDRCMEAQITEYGGQIEGCPSYHNGCTYWFAFRKHLSAKYGFPVPDGYDERLDMMFRHSLYATRAIGTNFPWGDSHVSGKETLSLAAVACYMATGRREYLETAFHFYPESIIGKDIADNLWRIEDLEKLRNDYEYAGRNPRRPSIPTLLWDKALDHVYYRTGWDRDDLSLMAACRVPVKNRHAHMDPGGFDMTAYGASMVADPGIFAYKDDENRHLFKSTSYHSTATINGDDAWEYLGSWKYGEQGRGRIEDVQEKNGVTSILLSHDCYKPTVMRRNIIIADGSVIVIDRASGTSEERRMKVFFHLDFEQAEMNDDGSFKMMRDGKGLMLIPLYGNSGAEAIPSRISTANRVAHPSTRIALTSLSHPVSLMVTALVPFRDEPPMKAFMAEDQGSTLSIRIGERSISADRETLELL